MALISTCGIDHIVLHVSNLQVSKRFYVDVLGCESWKDIDNYRSFLRCGDCQIGLFQCKSGHKPQADAEVDHVCLRSTLPRDKIISSLYGANIRLVNRPEGKGWPASRLIGIYFKDPDGHTLQLLPAGSWPQTSFEE